MKTKILFSALAGVMVATGASALSTDEIMVRCNASKDTVWDSYNKTCVPRNPCKKDGYAAYCNRRFAGTQLSGIGKGYTLVDAYVKFTDGQNASCHILGEPGILGQDYIGCTYDNGHYVVFEFDDLSQHGREQVPHSMVDFSAQETGCYGFEEESYPDGNGPRSNWVKTPITPRMCLVDIGTEGPFWEFCGENLTSSGDFTLLTNALTIAASIAFQDATIHNGKASCYIENQKKKTSPDGTVVECFELSCY